MSTRHLHTFGVAAGARGTLFTLAVALDRADSGSALTGFSIQAFEHLFPPTLANGGFCGRLDNVESKEGDGGIEHSDLVSSYARNDHLELAIPYEYLATPHSYFPDFLMRLTNGCSVLLEIKGEEHEQDRAKHQAARRWVSAVNHWGREGRWEFIVSRDPQQVGSMLANLAVSPKK